MNLYEIAAEYRGKLNILEGMEDLDAQTIADTLEGESGPLEGKVLAVAAFIRNLEAEAEAIKKAAADMKARSEARANKAERMREYLMACMDLAKRDSFAGLQFDVKKVKNPPSLVITNEDSLKFVPDSASLWKTIPEVPAHDVLDTVAVKKALMAGVTLAGAELRHGYRVAIK